MELVAIFFKAIGIIKETKFKTGDHVERIEGGPLMIVESVSRCKKSKSLIFSCRWFDSKNRQTRVDVFNENDIKFFDWYNPN